MQAREVHTFRMQLPVPGTLATAAVSSFGDMDVLAESVPQPDPAVALRQVARTVVAQATAANAAPAQNRDDVCTTRAQQWVDYAMTELNRLGDNGRTIDKAELEQINKVITEAAQHLQMLRHEAETGTTPETRQFIDDQLGHLQNAYSIYSQIPFGQYRRDFFNAVYARYTIVNAGKDNLAALTSMANRVGGNVPDFDLPRSGGGSGPAAPSPSPQLPQGPGTANSVQSPTMTPGVGVSMPLPFAGMPIPGMPYPFPQPGVPIAGMPPLLPMQYLSGMPNAFPNTAYAASGAASPYPHPSTTPIPVTIPGLKRAA